MPDTIPILGKRSKFIRSFSACTQVVSSSAVIAADIFQSTFAEDPRSIAAWQKYREAILEPGGSRDELKMVETYLGHARDPKFLIRSLETASPGSIT